MAMWRFLASFFSTENQEPKDTQELEPPTSSTGPHTDHDQDRHGQTRDGHTTGEHTPHDDGTREQRESLQQLVLEASELYVQKQLLESSNLTMIPLLTLHRISRLRRQ